MMLKRMPLLVSLSVPAVQPDELPGDSPAHVNDGVQVVLLVWPPLGELLGQIVQRHGVGGWHDVMASALFS